jgi:hypothetical protein
MSKWVDNVLSHYPVVGVRQGTRGVARKIDQRGLLALELCKILSKELGVPLANAVAIANDIVNSRSSSVEEYRVAPGVVLQFSLEAVESDLFTRVRDASESVAVVRRGRPPLHRSG